MKIITAIINTLLTMLLISFFATLASFFLAIFLPENVKMALEIFKNLLQIP